MLFFRPFRFTHSYELTLIGALGLAVFMAGILITSGQFGKSPMDSHIVALYSQELFTQTSETLEKSEISPVQQIISDSTQGSTVIALFRTGDINGERQVFQYTDESEKQFQLSLDKGFLSLNVCRIETSAGRLRQCNALSAPVDGETLYAAFLPNDEAPGEIIAYGTSLGKGAASTINPITERTPSFKQPTIFRTADERTFAGELFELIEYPGELRDTERKRIGEMMLAQYAGK